MSAEEIEEELTEQLQEQQDALAAVLEALESDANANGMREMRVALEEGISDMRAALLDLKKSRLLEALQQSHQGATQSPPQPEEPAQEEHPGSGRGDLEGRHCRFRYTDGVWHAGVVRGVTGTEIQVDFRRPTRMHQLCLVTLPEDLVQIESSREPPAEIDALEEGVRVLARLPGGGGLWEQAEVLSTHTNPVRVRLIFPGHQSTRAELELGEVWLPTEETAAAAETMPRAGPSAGRLSMGADSVADSDPDNSSDDSEDAEEDGEAREGEESHLGLGQAGAALKASLDAIESAAACGPQTDVNHFAEWETHTRGIASKMMAAMGYITGRGLGRGGKGRALPLEVRLLQPGKGLGADEGRLAAGLNGKKKKKRRRGGERHKHQKHAQRRKDSANSQAQQQMEAEIATGTPGLFSFINTNLGDKSEAAEALGSVGGPGKKSRFGQHASHRPSKGPAQGQKADGCPRQEMMGQQQKALELKSKLSRLGEMLRRNVNDKVIRQQVQRKIEDTKRELAAAEKSQRQAQSHENDKAKMKKWMKF